MAINRRRAASSAVSSEKKINGHRYEEIFSELIGGEVLRGTQKGDVKDQQDFLYSVKTGKKWQIFLYSHDRIESSKYLNVLLPCLEAFPLDSNLYFRDRTKCIEFKELFVKKYGREAAKTLSNSEVIKAIGSNEYVESKNRLALATSAVCSKLADKKFLRNFLSEALFNIDEVNYLSVRDSTYLKDNNFKVFDREDVLNVFSAELLPANSRAGNVPEDFNVPGQKTLLKYNSNGSTEKNIVEIEIRNDSDVHYRQVRFNMYSKDALTLLIENLRESVSIGPRGKVQYFRE